MNNILKYIEQNIIKSTNKCGLDVSGNIVSFSNRPDIADFQTNIAFGLAKQMGKNPIELAQQIADNFDEEFKTIFNVSVVKPAFINFRFTNSGCKQVLTEMLNNSNFGIEKITNKQTIVLDYGGANIAKELHMGHLRSPIIGECITRLYKLFGYNTISDVHLGDWGLQMGLIMAILYKEGSLDYYFNGRGEKPKITLDFLNENYPKASALSKTDSEFKKLADDFTLSLQQLKEPYFTIWKDIKEVSIKAIKRNYLNLNCKFDLWLGESDAHSHIEKTINTFINKGLTSISDDALVVEVKRDGEHIPIPKKDPSDKQLYKNPMPPVIIKKHNGGDLYATTDLATIMQRVEQNKNLSEIIYITDKRQSNHFEGVFRASKLAQIAPPNLKLTHVGYGTMNGKDGKPFKTREGGVVKLEDIINMVSSKAKEKLISNGVDISVNKDLPLQIGVGAMKFGDLSNETTKDYIFDLDSFMSFEGKTGPYLQYTAVRIKSLLNKAGNFNNQILIVDDNMRPLVIEIIKLIDSLKSALINLAPNLVCNSVYNLASAFSCFYNNVRILSCTNQDLRTSYLSISKLVLDKISLALNCLAIDIPEKM